MPEPVTSANKLEHELSKLPDKELYDLLEEDHPEPLSEAQVAQATLDRRADVQRSIRKYRDQATIAFLVLFAGILIASYLSLKTAGESREAIAESAGIVAVINCNRDFETILSLREGLDGNDRKVLKGLGLPDCRMIEGVVTQATEKRVRPDPLYPGSPAAKNLIQNGG